MCPLARAAVLLFCASANADTGRHLGVLMRANALRRLILAIPALALCGALPAPDRTQSADTRSAETPRASLAGQLLIAPPGMTDPRFDRVVILVLQHDKDGALGIVINRPLGQRPMADLIGDSAVSGNVDVFVGGPVEPNVGFIVHSADYHRAVTLDVDGRVAMTANREVLRDIADKKGPAKVLIAFGYAGWAPGQLEAELAHNVWYTAPEDPALVFDDDRDKVWEHATARRTQDL
jgi:putative transcriptional regulator